ncbi:ribonuclease toxin immunity protein CdiI [Lysinibacillus fusiformis]|uniref:ribonuclease toxin immunity protein CdiI n=1 Tax=Lysinibacillus fusiformis TaxID=28031 RepID=UPI002D7A3ADF|nr:ribonuclease toxin immunity protein CdiI [Lysinibacillus fusiformis]WRS97143.1 ribonuclease toxin immunity protein CdiI [Lysinibacillus fusiformis]
MSEEIFIIEKFSEKVELMRLYYKIIGDGKFMEAIDNFKNNQGFGVEPVCCIFANEYQPEEEGSFGETGVNFSIQPPMAEVEENAIVDENMFFQYLTEAGEDYLTRRPQDRTRVEVSLIELKEILNLS